MGKGRIRNPALNRRVILTVVVAAMLLALPQSVSGSSSARVILTVYSDGYVHATQSFTVDPKATSVQVMLFSSVVSDLVATDQSGSPLSYGFANGGKNLTVYTLGATEVTVAYDTNSITSKNGTVWSLEFSSDANSTVVLPILSTLSSVSGTPYSINNTGSYPMLRLPPGAWKIDYGIPLSSSTSTTSTISVPGLAITPLELEAGGVVAAVILGGIALMVRRRRGSAGTEGLRPDDVQVLSFIRERGGKVLEPEVRTKFALPKTSAWRQIKRLERLGYVRVVKVGSLNQIELVKIQDSTS